VGLDIVEIVPAGPGSLAERMAASEWSIELPGVSEQAAREAVERFLACEQVGIERLTKNGKRLVDARSPVLRATVSGVVSAGTDAKHAIIDLVVRQVTPAVRPDDIVAALRTVGGLAPEVPHLAVRRAQGPLDAQDAIGDPLAADRDHVTSTS
jgi:hypothetical protein